jgi:octaprenyl-diphosphate synthase
MTAIARALALVADDMSAIELRLTALMQSPIGAIPEVAAHLLSAGGKRLRPLLAALAARAAGVDPELGIAVGAAAELIHTATLYHDDVVDDGRVRRGRPAARMIFGNGAVVLVGDFCLARALETVVATGALRAVQTLSRAITEMAEGEVAQLQGAGDPDASIARYYDVIDRKTAALIAWAARVGGSASAEWDGPLHAFGREVGRAFQIADDVLDADVSEVTAGKTVGNDLREGKMTLPLLLGCEADPALRARVRAELGEHGVGEPAAQEILRLTHSAGGFTRARAVARELAERAASRLTELPASPYRDALCDVAAFSVDRRA